MTRFEKILIGLLVVLLGVILVVGLLLWIQPDEQRPPPVVGIEPTSVFAGQPAQVAYAAAQQAANAWQADARLLRASGTWPQGSRLEEMRSGRAVWTFTFYSAESGEVATVAVTEGPPAAQNPRPVAAPLTPADVSGWQVDSNDAVNIAFQAGAEAFLAQADIATLNMELSTANENGRMEWLVTFLAPQTGNSFIIRLDATSGEVIETIET